MEAGLSGVAGLEVDVDDAGQSVLNPQGINCLRMLPGVGPVVWGARTVRGGVSGDEFRYLSVRRLALHIQESVHRGTAWVDTQPNGEPLWTRVQHSVEAFLNQLFREGAFQGATHRDAYFVKCGRETMTQADIDAGRLVVLIGIAPSKPAEFVVLRVDLRAARPGP